MDHFYYCLAYGSSRSELWYSTYVLYNNTFTRLHRPPLSLARRWISCIEQAVYQIQWLCERRHANTTENWLMCLLKEKGKLGTLESYGMYEAWVVVL